MNHIAIDLGGSKSQVCVRNSVGEILEEVKIETPKLKQYLKKQPHATVIMETCSESWKVGDLAKQAGHNVKVVPTYLVRSLGVGNRGIKNDRKDAQALSEVSTRIDLPSVHIRSVLSREIQVELKLRGQLVGSRTQLINSVRGWMRTETIRIKSGVSHTFPQRLRKKEQSLPEYIDRQLDQIAYLSESIQKADQSLQQQAKKNANVVLLQSIPGIGVLTSLAFLSVVDTIDRFKKAHHLESYLGLTPGERSSGKKIRTTSITKAGSSMLRTLLVQAAWTLYVHRPNEPIVKWAKEIEERRGKKMAIVALARKLTGICYAVWKTNTPYQSKRTVSES